MAAPGRDSLYQCLVLVAAEPPNFPPCPSPPPSKGRRWAGGSRCCHPREIRLYSPPHEAFPRRGIARERQGSLKRGLQRFASSSGLCGPPWSMVRFNLPFVGIVGDNSASPACLAAARRCATRTTFNRCDNALGNPAD